jgi:hypothetical protein
MGLSMTPLAVAGTAGMPRHEAGLASGLINTSRQVGGAVGLAALSTIAAHTTKNHTGHDPKVALAAGFGDALLGAAVLLAASAVVAVFLPKRSAQSAGAPAQAAPAGAAASDVAADVAAVQDAQPVAAVVME